MKISLCMIVRNESDCLDTCLNAVNEYVDEIVIVDTGSMDNTLAIAKKYTDLVYEVTWENDFSAARNLSLSKATNDWVLVLDADEIVTEFNRISIEKSMADNHNWVGRINIVNIFDKEDELNQFTEKVSRLFKKSEFCYEGNIHEQIVRNDKKAYNLFDIKIEVVHNGYMKSILKDKRKIERNIDLLQAALEKKPLDEYLLYQLGKSYYLTNDFATASSYFQQAINKCDDFRLEYTEDLVESYAYSLINLGNYHQALDIINYEVYFSKSADFYFLLGLIYMNVADFDSAVNSFTTATRKEQFRVKGTNTYKAFYNIGVIHEVLGNRESANEAYIKAGDYKDARERIVF